MMISWQVSVRVCAVSEIVKQLSKNRMNFGYMIYVNIDELPGLYCFWVRNVCLYVGMSSNLRRRLKQHCEAEDNPELIEHFDAYSNEIEMTIAYEEDADERRLRRLESEAIKKMSPIANRQGVSR